MKKNRNLYLIFICFTVIFITILSVLNTSKKTVNIPSMSYVEFCPSVNKCNKLSRLVMGTDHLQHDDWTHPGQKSMSEVELFNLLDETVKRGINTFDTSRIYVGAIEKKLGKWIPLGKI